MEKRRTGWKNTLQNILIVLLSMSAILLFLDISNVFSGSKSSLSSLLSGNDPTVGTSAPTKLADISAPVSVAIAGAYGRYGNLTLTTTDEDFSSLGTLLREALGSSGAFAACSKRQFRSALSSSGIYYDFRTVLPLSVLGGLVGASVKNTVLSARRMVLCSAQNGVLLYITDDNSFYCCTTQAPKADLSKAISCYQLGNVSFAFELSSAMNLAPYSLFLTEEQPAFPTLIASNPLNTTAPLLKAMGFNPHTKNRYTDSSGTLVVVDGNRTLHIQTNGLVTYQDEDSNALQVSTSAKETLSDKDAVIGCYRLLVAGNNNSGNASLFLKNIQPGKDGQTLKFDYQISGTQIRRGNGMPAAQIVLRGNAVSSLRFYVRRYLPSEKESLILPLRQALALAEKHTGKELKICYADNGASSVTAGWQIR